MTNYDFEESGFEERADYILEEDILKWNVDIPHFESIQKRLIEKGAKVIVGPRGTGKTHQMKISYSNCIDKKNHPFPVYVSFSKYYHLEPLLSKNPAAIAVFHTWVLCKILLGCVETLQRIKNTEKIELFNFAETSIALSKIEKFVSQAEKNIQENWHSEIINSITIQSILSFITKSANECGRKRSILLLDDAALTLTKEYMVEFFDIFRSLKTMNVSPKASVYPGTTEYGPRFHLKQDGDPFNVWFEPEAVEYTDFVNQLIEKRFKNISTDISIREVLKYASFGNPRAFITLLRDFEEDTSKSSIQVKFNKIIEMRCKLLEDEYMSISQKLNQYTTIIETGWKFFDEITTEMATYNKRMIQIDNGEKQVLIGLGDYKDKSIDRMIKFLIEAGLLYQIQPVKHGEDREYKRFMPHFIFLLQKKAFSKSKGFNVNEILEFLQRKNVKHPLRKDNVYNILENGALKNLKLDLPSCSNCGANRLSENQKFCHECGAQLISKSSFEKCMKLTIDELPLTQFQKRKIKQDTELKTVKDFLAVADLSDELRKSHGIGKRTAEKIINKVNKLIEEFLA